LTTEEGQVWMGEAGVEEKSERVKGNGKVFSCILLWFLKPFASVVTIST